MGPLFWHELRQLGRQGRLYFLRLALVLLAAGLWFHCYAAIEQRAQQSTRFTIKIGDRIFSGAPLAEVNVSLVSRVTIEVGQEFLFLFTSMTTVVVLLIAPLLVVGGLASDRQRGTLDLLLTTDLTGWELLLGKVLPRVLLLGVLVLGMLGVPMLAHLQGGINVELLFVGALVPLSMLLSQAAVTALLAAWGARPSNVLLISYLLLAGWLGLGFINFWPLLPEVAKTLPWVNGPAMLTFLRTKFAQQGTLGLWPWQLASVHALCHLTFAVCLLGLAAFILRRGQQRAANWNRRPGRRWWRRHRPPLGERHPLLWKERGAVSRRTWLLWLLAGLVVLATFAIDTWDQQLNTLNRQRTWMVRRELVSRLYYWMTTISIASLVLPVAVAASRAAWCFRTESDRATWDTLLSTPTSLRHILLAKWWASFLAAAPPLLALTLALGGIYALSVYLVAQLEPLIAHEMTTRGWMAASALAIILVMTAMTVSLGLFMSVVCATALRALVATFSAILTFFFLPLALGYQLGTRITGEVLMDFIDVIEAVVWLGVPIMLLLGAGLFDARWRAWLHAAWRVLGIPVGVGLALQAPMLLLIMVIMIYDARLTSVPFMALLSPIGFLLGAANELTRTYLRDALAYYSAAALAIFAVLTYVLWKLAEVLAARRSERLGDRPLPMRTRWRTPAGGKTLWGL